MKVVSDAAGLEALCSRVREAPRVALDTEFHNERSYTARLMVVQLVVGDSVFIVDPLAVPQLDPLIAALGETVVVGHALHGDLRIFAERFGLLPATVFDTQVAAAFCGYGVAVSLLDLVQAVAGVRLRKSQTVSDWSTRPFTERQLEYLVDDVGYLFALHDSLQRTLTTTGRLEWATAEMAPLTSLATFTHDPERQYLKISGSARLSRRELGVLRELTGLRDRLARAKDVPLKYIFPDDVLIGLASLCPSTVEEISQLRRLEASVRKAFGAEIVAAVARAMNLSEEELPPRPLRPASLQRETLLSLLQVVAGAIADEHGLPSALLAPRAALDRVARALPKNADEMRIALELTDWRADLLTPRLLDLLHGRTALTVTGVAVGAPRIIAVPHCGESLT
jgi:ribonuclease D